MFPLISLPPLPATLYLALAFATIIVVGLAAAFVHDRIEAWWTQHTVGRSSVPSRGRKRARASVVWSAAAVNVTRAAR